MPALASDSLTVTDSTGADVGTVFVSDNAADIIGINTTQFTVAGVTVPVDDLETALADSDIDFSGADFTAGDLAAALGESSNFDMHDLTESINSALLFSDIDLSGTGITEADIAAALDGIDISDLPADGTVYSITNLGGGFYNVYEAVPNADGDAAHSITDTLVTPFGNIDIPTDYDAVANLDAGGPFEGLGAGGAGDLSNAFTIDGTTFDPGADGFDSIQPLLGVAPLLAIGGGYIQQSPGDFHDFATQDLALYDDSGTVDLGTTQNGVYSLNMLGIIEGTQLTVRGITPTADPIAAALADSSGISFDPSADVTAADLAAALAGSNLDFGENITGDDIIGALRDTDVAHAFGIFGGSFVPGAVDPGITFTPDAAADAMNTVDSSDLPTDGTVYSVVDFGGGFANVYTAVANADGTAATSITDTLVTPFGNIDIPTAFDAVGDLDPGNAFTGLDLGGGDLGSDNAFTLGDVTFDPGADGFDGVYPVFGVAPLLAIGGGRAGDLFDLAHQPLAVYEDGADLGSVQTAIQTSNLLGLIDSTEFRVTGVWLDENALDNVFTDSDIDFDNYNFDAGDLAAALTYALTSGRVTLFDGDLTGLDLARYIGATDLDLTGVGLPDVNAMADAINAAVAADADVLPDDGTVYSVINFGGGFANLYTATPGDDGATSISDTLVTPWGNWDIVTDFDATTLLDPGDAVTGLDAATAAGFDLFDPSTWF